MSEKITSYGHRIKEEAKRHNLSNRQMADILHYSNEKQISPIYSGKHKLSEDRFEELAKIWNVRIDYLKCKDDFRTEEDLLKSQHNHSKSNLQLQLRYLETIGFTISPCLYWIANLYEIYSYFSYMQRYISDSEIKHINELVDFTLSDDDADYKYDMNDHRNPIFVRLKTSPYDDEYLPDNLSKDNRLSSIEHNLLLLTMEINDKSLKDIRLLADIDIYFDISYKQKHLGRFSIDDTERMLMHLDNICVSCIHSLFDTGLIEPKERKIALQSNTLAI